MRGLVLLPLLISWIFFFTFLSSETKKCYQMVKKQFSWASTSSYYWFNGKCWFWLAFPRNATANVERRRFYNRMDVERRMSNAEGKMIIKITVEKNDHFIRFLHEHTDSWFLLSLAVLLWLVFAKVSLNTKLSLFTIRPMLYFKPPPHIWLFDRYRSKNE